MRSDSSGRPTLSSLDEKTTDSVSSSRPAPFPRDAPPFDPATSPLWESYASDTHHPPQISTQRLSGIGRTIPITMIVCFLGSFVLAAIHHGLCLFLDEKTVNRTLRPSVSSKIGVTITILARLLSGFSMMVAIEQMAWYHVRRRPFTLSTLDGLFALPSASSLLRRPNLVWIAPMAAVGTMVMTILPITTVIAPTALEVVPAGFRHESIAVPTLDLDRWTFSVVSNDTDGAYLHPRLATNRLVNQAILGQQVLPSSPPPHCGTACKYGVQYYGPALRCEDRVLPHPRGILHVTSHGTSGPDLYNDPPRDHSELYTFAFGYIFSPRDSDPDWVKSLGVRVGNTESRRFGSFCYFYNATYQADVQFGSTSQLINAKVVKYHQPLNVTKKEGPLSAKADPLGNSFGMADAFTAAMNGTMDSDCTVVNTIAPLSAVVNLHQEWNRQKGGDRCSFQIPTRDHPYNVSSLLERLMANVTASFIDANTLVGGKPTRPGTRPIINSQQPYKRLRARDVLVRPDFNVYKYEPWVLLTTYAVLLSIDLLVSLTGLWCLKRNRIPGTFDFSMILATTKQLRMDGALGLSGLGTAVLYPKVAQEVKLKYGELEGEETPTAGFGLEGTVRPLRTGTSYN